MLRCISICLTVFLAANLVAAEPAPTKAEAQAALRKAVTFFSKDVAKHGGYVYAYSGDLKLSEGEGVTDADTIWVQPPGTPSVGEAFLEAYEATRDEFYLEAAMDACNALLRGQLESGGWNYSIKFNPAEREKLFYRKDLQGQPQEVRLPKNKLVGKDGAPLAAGWSTWKSYRISGNQTQLDDNTTQAATRFLVRLDRAVEFKNAALHEAASYALDSLLAAQYPCGGWSANYDRFPKTPPAERDYPVLKASLPESVSPAWPKDFTGCYTTNDNLVRDMLETLFFAHAVYKDERYLAAAKRAGDFLIRAQLPDPQPAWAQQYDSQMRPVWCRAFEPPAVSGGESQGILDALMDLYQHSSDKKYLEPIPRAIAYLRKSQLKDGRLARFYELKTNRPIYFTRVDGQHQWTYEDDKIASGYGYIVSSKVAALENRYQQLLKTPVAELLPAPQPPGKPSDNQAAAVRKLIAALDERGAWVQRGRLAHHKVEPPSGVINSATFAKNVHALCDYLRGL
jgi:hypothetical protein